ncbi:MAG TPA: hypothetical protein VIF14_03895 [Alphaproteobacteria bacterium]|jgi:hypothetical protein
MRKSIVNGALLALGLAAAPPGEAAGDARLLRATQPMTLMALGPYSEPSGAFFPSVLY